MLFLARLHRNYTELYGEKRQRFHKRNENFELQITSKNMADLYYESKSCTILPSTTETIQTCLLIRKILDRKKLREQFIVR